MGLSAISAKLRRHRLKPKPTYPTPRDDIFTSRRLKTLTADTLLDILKTLTTPLTSLQATTLSTHIASTPTLLSSLLQILTTPLPSPSTRATHPNPWIISTLLVHGPPPLRAAIAAHPDHIRTLAAIFSTPVPSTPPKTPYHAPSTLPAPTAAAVIALLRALLQDHPRQTASALSKTSLVSDLVRHIHLQPAADLLPLLLAARIFSPLRAPPIVPAHKRTIAMLGRAEVQHLLAACFVAAMDAMQCATCVERNCCVQVIDNAAAAMAELSIRAVVVPFKVEDADERHDAAFATGFGLVSAHVYNDALAHLTLVSNTRPLETILQAALDGWRKSTSGNPTRVVLPALQTLTRVLAGLREARVSVVPSVRRAVAAVDAAEIGPVLGRVAPQLRELLEGEEAPVGQLRLAVVDLVREVCATLPSACVEDIVVGHGLLAAVLRVASNFEGCDVLQIGVAHILCALLTRFDAVGERIVTRLDVVQFLFERRERGVLLSDALCAAGAYANCDKVKDPAVRGMLAEIDMACMHRRELLELVTLPSVGSKMAKVSSDIIRELELDDALIANEDYGQELYLHAVLDEVCQGGDRRTPPSDNHVASRAEDITRGWGKGLSGRLKSAYHQYR